MVTKSHLPEWRNKNALLPHRPKPALVISHFYYITFLKQVYTGEFDALSF